MEELGAGGEVNRTINKAIGHWESMQLQGGKKWWKHLHATDSPNTISSR